MTNEAATHSMPKLTAIAHAVTCRTGERTPMRRLMAAWPVLVSSELLNCIAHWSGPKRHRMRMIGIAASHFAPNTTWMISGAVANASMKPGAAMTVDMHATEV